MNNQDISGYNVETYVRPNQPYACGRSCAGGTPCWQGPSAKGKCGGASGCSPMRVGDRWECQRPKSAGGPCSEGPLPNGACAHTHPPCAPRRNLRSLRGMFSIIGGMLLLLLLVIGVNPLMKSAVNLSAIDAGSLSSVHSGFTREQGCVSCHKNHGNQAGAWLLSAFGKSDASEQCVDCHRFDGPAQLAHNVEKAKHPKYAGRAMDKVSCASCHREHQGSEAHLRKVADTACATCHKPAFDNFAKGHPAFSPKYPLANPGNVFFDHAAHIQDYFVNPKHTKGSNRDAKFAAIAKSDCSSCHAVNLATREIKLKTYDQVCAGCHKSQVTERELVLFDPERMTVAASLLFGLSRDGDDEANQAALKKMWQSMASEGRAGLAKVSGGALIAGLSDAEARRAGTAWAKKSDLSPADAPETGWFTGENSEGNPSLFYRAGKHTDPVMIAWMKKLRAGLSDPDADKRSIAKELMAEFLDKQTGPGACGKCHAVGLRTVTAKAKPDSEWQYAPPAAKEQGALTRYSHAKHLGVANPAGSCKTCHQINAKSTYAKYFTPKAVPVESYESNFSSITKQTCGECHQKGRVDASCQVCHAYHAKHMLNVGSAKKEN